HQVRHATLGRSRDTARQVTSQTSAGRIWVLGTCNTCTRLVALLPEGSVEVVDFRKAPVDEETLDRWIGLAGSVVPLFSKRARKYRELGLHERELSADEMRALILEHDTFIKRPVAVLNGTDGAQIFIGSTKATIAALQEALS
ncbi:MAG: arsenate reductase, partial [Cognaticolwellia sp.]